MAKKKESNANGSAAYAEVTALAKATEERAVSFVQPLDATWFKGVSIEKVVTLEEGQGIRGTFLGEGGEIDVSDPVTGEVKAIKSWRVEVAPGIVVRLLGASQLNASFGKMSPNTRVRIGRLGQVETRRGRRVTEYFVGTES